MTPRPAPPPLPILERKRLRIEYQTLRRLPRSSAIAFTMRVYLTALAVRRGGLLQLYEARRNRTWFTGALL